MLSNPHSQLQVLHLQHNNIDDKAVFSLADGLSNSTNLTQLDIAKGNSISNWGWAALSITLCDTESISDTYCSNHKLTTLGQGSRRRNQSVVLPRDLEALLVLNGKFHSSFVSIQKILDNHHEWDLAYLVEEKLQFLPYIVSWIDRATNLNANIDGNTSANRRKNERILRRRRMMTIHQFVCRLPLVVIDKLRTQL